MTNQDFYIKIAHEAQIYGLQPCSYYAATIQVQQLSEARLLTGKIQYAYGTTLCVWHGYLYNVCTVIIFLTNTINITNSYFTICRSWIVGESPTLASQWYERCIYKICMKNKQINGICICAFINKNWETYKCFHTSAVITQCITWVVYWCSIHHTGLPGWFMDTCNM